MSRYQYILNTFGMRAIKPLFYGNGKPLKKNSTKYPEGQPAEVEKFDTYPDGIQKMSMLGTPVFSDVVLVSPDGKLIVELDAVLCEVTQKKRIVKTNIVGRNGSVKEYINEDDYVVNLKGVLLSDKPDTVPDQLSELNKIALVNDSVAVVSPFLDVFDIHNIVIESLKINQIEGKLNVISFDIASVSDVELSILVNDEQAI